MGEIEVLEQGESGLMGMAFHPDFTNRPYLYLAHSYRDGGGVRNRLIRVLYDGTGLGPPEILIDDIPGRSNHDGSRLTVGPDGYLYMTMGDAGRSNLAQDLASLAGKILRVTLDGRPAPDNPFNSLVYSYGHRNPQGIVFHPNTGDLYVAEHGPSDNDEVSRIVRAATSDGLPFMASVTETHLARRPSARPTTWWSLSKRGPRPLESPGWTITTAT